jgi:hypothetical protein
MDRALREKLLIGLAVINIFFLLQFIFGDYYWLLSGESSWGIRKFSRRMYGRNCAEWYFIKCIIFNYFYSAFLLNERGGPSILSWGPSYLFSFFLRNRHPEGTTFIQSYEARTKAHTEMIRARAEYNRTMKEADKIRQEADKVRVENDFELWRQGEDRKQLPSGSGQEGESLFTLCYLKIKRSVQTRLYDWATRDGEERTDNKDGKV